MALLLTSVFGVTGCGSDDDVQADSRVKNVAPATSGVSDAPSKADCDARLDLIDLSDLDDPRLGNLLKLLALLDGLDFYGRLPGTLDLLDLLDLSDDLDDILDFFYYSDRDSDLSNNLGDIRGLINRFHDPYDDLFDLFDDFDDLNDLDLSDDPYDDLYDDLDDRDLRDRSGLYALLEDFIDVALLNDLDLYDDLVDLRDLLDQSDDLYDLDLLDISDDPYARIGDSDDLDGLVMRWGPYARIGKDLSDPRYDDFVSIHDLDDILDLLGDLDDILLDDFDLLDLSDDLYDGLGDFQAGLYGRLYVGYLLARNSLDALLEDLLDLEDRLDNLLDLDDDIRDLVDFLDRLDDLYYYLDLSDGFYDNFVDTRNLLNLLNNPSGFEGLDDILVRCDSTIRYVAPWVTTTTVPAGDDDLAASTSVCVDDGEGVKRPFEAAVEQFREDLALFRVVQNGRNDQSLTEEQRQGYRANYSSAYDVKTKSAAAAIQVANERGFNLDSPDNLDESFLRKWDSTICE
jgi:hypothetical protein